MSTMTDDKSHGSPFSMTILYEHRLAILLLAFFSVVLSVALFTQVAYQTLLLIGSAVWLCGGIYVSWVSTRYCPPELSLVFYSMAAVGLLAIWADPTLPVVDVPVGRIRDAVVGVGFAAAGILAWWVAIYVNDLVDELSTKPDGIDTNETDETETETEN